MIVRDLEYILNQLHITYYSDWLHSSLTINDTIVSIIGQTPFHPIQVQVQVQAHAFGIFQDDPKKVYPLRSRC